MTDLENEFPSWGETGEYPSDGFSYDTGDQINQKHMDGLWNGINEHFSHFIDGITKRVADFEGDVVLDGGLAVSQGANTREVEVTASTEGAYVDGQDTGSVSATSFTLSTNGGTSTRTDSIWVDTAGQVGTSEGTTTVSDSRHKIAEIDVATDDTISDVRQTARRIARHVAGQTYNDDQIGTRPGDLFQDLSVDKLKVWQNGAFRTVITDDNASDISDAIGVDVSDDGTVIVAESTDIDFGSNLSVSDDGDGTVTVDAASFADTRTDVSDSGSHVVANTEDINFDANLDVTDDGDGTVTVSAQSSTDTTTDVSDNGTTVVNQTDDINFGADLSASDDGDGTVTVDATVNTFSGSHNDLSNVGSNDHHSRYSNSEALSAVNNDPDHGSTASHNYFSGSHNDLSNVGSSDHHAKYTDSDAIGAVENADFTDLSTGALSSTDGSAILFNNGISIKSGNNLYIEDGGGTTRATLFAVSNGPRIKLSGTLELLALNSTTQHQFTDSGNINISGTLTENASL